MSPVMKDNETYNTHTYGHDYIT